MYLCLLLSDCSAITALYSIDDELSLVAKGSPCKTLIPSSSHYRDFVPVDDSDTESPTLLNAECEDLSGSTSPSDLSGEHFPGADLIADMIENLKDLVLPLNRSTLRRGIDHIEHVGPDVTLGNVETSTARTQLPRVVVAAEDGWGTDGDLDRASTVAGDEGMLDARSLDSEAAQEHHVSGSPAENIGDADGDKAHCSHDSS
ncbi:hypothetical protein POM88_019130 [Heracleum sosnowskyi]|uniref:Uncharacterized protein n=1 Tax=Heracleum sosnowskyi TaxID=360622 RepID=A0AAD8IRS4_9APIA|nr:hypothetical protein POM88_019130 [Heracleum sosnowskyi]